MKFIDVRIVVRPTEPGDTPQLVDWLQTELQEDGRISPEQVSQVPREEPGPKALGSFNDLVVQLAINGAGATAGYLVRMLASRLSTQPDTELTATIERDGERVEIKASGTTTDQLQEIMTRIDGWVQQPPSGE